MLREVGLDFEGRGLDQGPRDPKYLQEGQVQGFGDKGVYKKVEKWDFHKVQTLIVVLGPISVFSSYQGGPQG